MWPLEANSAAWSAVGRPPGRPANGRFLTVVPAVDRPVDRGLDTERSSSLPVERPVDRGHFQRAELSGSRPGWSTGPPSKQAVHVCARRSTDLWHGRPCDRPAEGQKQVF